MNKNQLYYKYWLDLTRKIDHNIWITYCGQVPELIRWFYFNAVLEAEQDFLYNIGGKNM